MSATTSPVQRCSFLLLACFAAAHAACKNEHASPAIAKSAPTPRAAAATVQPTKPPEPSGAAQVADAVPEPEPPEVPAWIRGPRKPWQDLCAASAKATFPVADRPSTADREKLRPTASRLHYYGIGVPVDYVKARHAAFVELDRSAMEVFGDATVLMMLYANGYGTPQNIDLAIKLACGIEGAPMEIESRVAHLDSLRARPGATPFDLCDDITSGFMEGHCEALSEERRQVERARELAALTASWPTQQLEALGKLRVASEAFWGSRAGNEIDLSGTARGAAITQEEATGKQTLLDALRGFERGDVPRHSIGEYEAAERELNRAYKLALAKDLSGSTVTPDGIRATEKKWLVFREAWVAFGALRYPEVSPEAWRASLAAARTAHLSDL